MRQEKLVIFGDSISTPLVGNGGYAKHLQRYLPHLRIVNRAVAASAAGGGAAGSLLPVLQACAGEDADATAVLVWHGTNDWYWGTPVGAPESRDTQSYSGALYRAVCSLRKQMPNATLLFATPLYRWQAAEGCTQCGDAWFTENRIGKTQRHYAEALWAMAQALCVPVVDTRLLSGFHAENQPQRLPDGVHPDERGCRVLAQIFADALQQLEKKGSV